MFATFRDVKPKGFFCSRKRKSCLVVLFEKTNLVQTFSLPLQRKVYKRFSTAFLRLLWFHYFKIFKFRFRSFYLHTIPFQQIRIIWAVNFHLSAHFYSVGV